MILVTGASGYVGQRVLRHLSSTGHSVVAMARNADKVERCVPAGVPVRIADYDDERSIERALDGVTSLLFIASDGDARDVMRHHANVVDAAATSRVEHITFTSIIDVEETSPFYFAAVYRDAEERLAACGVARTILRCGLYSDFILARWLEPARAAGEVSLPLNTAHIAPVSRDDVAQAAAATIISRDHIGRTYELTGTRSYPFAQLVEAAGSAFGSPLRYVPCSPTDYLRRAWKEMPDPWPHAFSTLCASIAQERYRKVTTDIATLLGRPAQSFEDFLARS